MNIVILTVGILHGSAGVARLVPAGGPAAGLGAAWIAARGTPGPRVRGPLSKRHSPGNDPVPGEVRRAAAAPAAAPVRHRGSKQRFLGRGETTRVSEGDSSPSLRRHRRQVPSRAELGLLHCTSRRGGPCGPVLWPALRIMVLTLLVYSRCSVLMSSLSLSGKFVICRV